MFRDNKAGLIVVSHTDVDAIGTSKPLSEAEIETLLQANAGGSKWKKISSPGFMKKGWETEDGKILASYDSGSNRLMVITKAEMDKMSAEKKAEEVKKLEGF
jgi:hypothetical protein